MAETYGLNTIYDRAYGYGHDDAEQRSPYFDDDNNPDQVPYAELDEQIIDRLVEPVDTAIERGMDANAGSGWTRNSDPELFILRQGEAEWAAIENSYTFYKVERAQGMGDSWPDAAILSVFGKIYINNTEGDEGESIILYIDLDRLPFIKDITANAIFLAEGMFNLFVNGLGAGIKAYTVAEDDGGIGPRTADNTNAGNDWQLTDGSYVTFSFTAFIWVD